MQARSSGADGTSDSAAGVVRPRQQPWHTRLRQALRLLVVFLIVPVAVGWLLGPKGAGHAAALGAVLVLASSMNNGRRATRLAVPVMILGAGLGALTKPEWPWVLVLAAFALASGVATWWGAGIAASMATLQAATAPPIDDLQRLGVLLGFTLLGAAYGWIMARRLGAPKASPAPLVSRRYVAILSIGLTAAVTLAASVAVATGWPRATWMVVAVVALGIPTPGLTERLMAQRMLGQLAACGIVTVITWLANSPWVLVTAALVLITLYLMSFGRPLAEQIAYLSAFFMLPAAAASGSSLVLALERIAYNLLGLGILGVVLLALRLVPAHRTVAGEPARDPGSATAPA